MSSDPSPVEPCKGWKEPCAFCDKRFGEWKEAEVEVEGLKLNKPMAFMFAYHTKQGKEIVSIGVHDPQKKQNNINASFTELKHRIADKSFKETKSTIYFRYSVLGQIDSKDSCVLYAHWYNYSTLPRMTTKWPCADILENCQHLHFSEMNKKWCYATKAPVWKHQKANVAPKAVKRCKGWTEECTFCNAQLSPWVSAKECIEKNMAPDAPGILLVAGNDGGKRETVSVTKCTVPISKVVKYEASGILRHLHNCKCLPPNKDKTVDVRWIVEDKKNNKDEVLYLLVIAHWLNYGSLPAVQKRCRSYDQPFDDSRLLDHSQFTFREKDKQWCYVAEENSDLRMKKTSPKNRQKGKSALFFSEDDMFE